MHSIFLLTAAKQKFIHLSAPCRRRASLLFFTMRLGARFCALYTVSSIGRHGNYSRRSSLWMMPAKEVRRNNCNRGKFFVLRFFFSSNYGKDYFFTKPVVFKNMAASKEKGTPPSTFLFFLLPQSMVL